MSHLLPTTLVGSYSQPLWLLDRSRLAGRFTELNDCPARAISIETAQPKLDCSVLAGLPDKTILLGVLDLSDPAVESPQVVAGRNRRGLEHVHAERVVVAPDGGLKYLDRDVAYGKMCAMVEGAARVRGELS